MKILIPAAAFLMGALAWTARTKPVDAPPAPLSSRTAEFRPAPVPQPAADVVEKRKADASPTAAKAPAETAVAPARVAADPVWALELHRELSLRDDQKARISEVLRERGGEVAAYEIEVRNRGWFRLEEFGWRIGRIRESSYDRIEAVLDPEQSRAFAALRPGLIKKDFLSIAIPEEQVVSLD